MIKNFLQRVGLFRAELAVVLGRVANVLVGPLAALAIATKLSPNEQGYYFSFVSIMLARNAFEAGVGQVIINTVGHARSGMDVTRAGAVGLPKVLAAVRTVLHFAVYWYAAAAMVMVIGVGAAGYIFFATQPPHAVSWQWPWLLFCAFNSLDFAFQSTWATIEGLNQIVSVYTMRIVKTLGTVAALTITAALGGGLWCIVAFQAAAILTDILLLVQWRRVFRDLVIGPRGGLDWRHEIWPFQWRMALSWAGGYLGIPIFVPAVFRTEGAMAAGQVGMTIAILTAVMGLAQSIIDARVPQFCAIIAERDWTRLDRLYLPRAISSAGLFVLGIGAAVAALFMANAIGLHLLQRIVPWRTFAIFSCAFGVNLIINIEAIYLRAHRKEPLMWISIGGGFVAAIGTITSATLFGSFGVAVSYLTLTSLIGFPIATFLFVRLRHRWHLPTTG